jgi:hypothetical protein
MADRSLTVIERNLDIDAQNVSNQTIAVNTAHFEAVTAREAITHRANYDLRAQLIILVLVLGLIAASYLLAKEGNNAMATLLGAGGIVAVIGSAIRGVSKK